MSYNLENKVSFDELSPSLQDLINSKGNKVDVEHNHTDIENNSSEIEKLKRSAGCPIGTVSFFASTIIPAGWLDMTLGSILDRAIYPDLWDYVSKNCKIVTDTEWLELAKTQTSVPVFSSGDGTTTFRLPKILDYMRPGINNDIGKYYGDAIRNITGDITSSGTYGPFWSGAVETMVGSGCITANKKGSGDIEGFAAGAGWSGGLSIDASKVVPTADENRPKTVVMLLCIKAFGAPVNEGTLDMAELANKVNAINEKLSKGLDNITVVTGTIGHGGTIPLPEGFTQEQCKWIVSPYYMYDYGTGNDMKWFRCYTNNNRVVVCSVEDCGDSSHTIANYMIIGIK